MYLHYVYTINYFKMLFQWKYGIANHHAFATSATWFRRSHIMLHVFIDFITKFY